MNGKVCIVTGGNTGIGKATVEGLAKQGATVVLACRDLDKGRAALEEVQARTQSNALHLMRLDLASLQSVREFVRAFTAKFQRLDVLVENAGVSTGKRQLTADGFEMDFGVNHLGHFLLVELLLPTLKASAPSRRPRHARAPPPSPPPPHPLRPPTPSGCSPQWTPFTPPSRRCGPYPRRRSSPC